MSKNQVKKLVLAAAALAVLGASSAAAKPRKEKKMKEQYTFELSDSVVRTKVRFKNHFGIEIAGDLYTPKSLNGTAAGIAVSGPFGAVKEQASGLYAAELASRGFVALAFDPSFTGESGGEPRYMNSPDINTEDFQAAVDFLSVQKTVDPEKIGIVGICGWGGMAVNAAAIDPRIKATVASTMYDMSRVAANGYFDADNSAEARQKSRRALSEQRTKDFAAGTYSLSGGVVDPLPEDAPQFVKDYYAYYKTPRGYHPRSLNSNGGWAVQASTSLLNTKLLAYAGEIESAVLVVHGENAHSRYFGEDTFKKLTGSNKELVIVPGASHCDLYDNKEKIPFGTIEEFFNRNLR